MCVWANVNIGLCAKGNKLYMLEGVFERDEISLKMLQELILRVKFKEEKKDRKEMIMRLIMP